MPNAADVTERPSKMVEAYFGDIVKFQRDANGHLEVYGKATGSNLDDDGQRMNAKWLEKSMPAWMEWGNLREQHSKIAAGVGRELSVTDKGDWMLKSLCVDPVTIDKIENGVLKGYSIRVLNAGVTKGTPATPGGEIVSGTIAEISYVDRPCLPDSIISICKAISTDTDDGIELHLEPTDVADAETVADPLIDDETVAEKPKTEKPVAEVVEKAAKSTVRSSKILTPSEYRKAEMTMRAVLDKAAGGVYDESADMAGAQASIASIADLIISEATELKKGRFEEISDISTLLDAARSLQYFYRSEQGQNGQPDETTPDVSTVASMAFAAGSKDDPAIKAARKAAKAQKIIEKAAGGSPAEGADVVSVGDLAKAFGDVMAAKLLDVEKAIGVKLIDQITTVTQAMAESSTAQEAKIASLQSDVSKVLATPVQGAPMLMGKISEVAKSAVPSRRHEFQANAARATDPNVKDTWLRRAAAEPA